MKKIFVVLMTLLGAALGLSAGFVVDLLHVAVPLPFHGLYFSPGLGFALLGGVMGFIFGIFFYLR